MTAPTPLEIATSLASQIGGQADLVWGISLALFTGEFFIICRFLLSPDKSTSSAATIFMGMSLLLLTIGLGAGYVAKGALVTMLVDAGEGRGYKASLHDAETAAIVQISLFALGFLCFIIAIAMDSRRVMLAMTGNR